MRKHKRAGENPVSVMVEDETPGRHPLDPKAFRRLRTLWFLLAAAVTVIWDIAMLILFLGEVSRGDMAFQAAAVAWLGSFLFPKVLIWIAHHMLKSKRSLSSIDVMQDRVVYHRYSILRGDHDVGSALFYMSFHIKSVDSLVNTGSKVLVTGQIETVKAEVFDHLPEPVVSTTPVLKSRLVIPAYYADMEGILKKLKELPKA